MLQQQDSISVQEAAPITQDSAVQRPARPQTPYQVLRMLPRDATPAQQDSAIRAWFQPGEIHYSDMPDTLHLPGHSVGRNLKEVNLPQYYRESFFSNDSLLHPELSGGRYGIAGDPLPYTVRTDNVFTSALIICFVVAIVSFSATRNFTRRQLKGLFYPTKSEEATSQTTSEQQFQFFLVFLTSFLLAISTFFYVTTYVARTFILDNEYYLIGIFVAVYMAYFIVKLLLYSGINLIFFEGKKNKQYLYSLLFVVSLEGVALYPVVLLQVYFDLPIRNALFCIISIVIIGKIVSFYKCWSIFFRRNAVFLQIFLYFCALEIMPMLALWGVLMLIVKHLEVIY